MEALAATGAQSSNQTSRDEDVTGLKVGAVSSRAKRTAKTGPGDVQARRNQQLPPPAVTGLKPGSLTLDLSG